MDGNDTATRAPDLEHRDTRAGGVGSGRLVVGDYTGARAAQAAQAVRCAGLRPGLERSFGADPSLLGLVIAQEPQAGSALARNGLVTLHIAAPGTGTTSAATPSSLPIAATTANTLVAEHSSRPIGVTPRRRKAGLARHSPLNTGVAPALAREASETSSTAGSQTDLEPARTDIDATEPASFDAQLTSDEPYEEEAFDGPSREEFIVRIDRMFATHKRRHQRSWWRGLTRRALRATGEGQGGVDERRRLISHPWLTAVGAFTVGLWVLLGSLGVLSGQHSVASRHTAIPRLTAQGSITHTHNKPGITSAHAARPAQSGHSGTARTPVAAQRGRVSLRGRRHASARGVVSAVAHASTVVSAPTRVSEPAPPRSEQVSGGPFSP
jgi:hypothetical protein